jgi:RNA polymerase sigma factor (TIGR02999 family)
MSKLTQILVNLESGDLSATEELLPLVYSELRQLAAAWLAQERPGQTLQATALVHEAYLRLLGSRGGPQWNGHAHFFGAAAEAMRRILVERARRCRRPKHGGGRHRVELDDNMPSARRDDELLAIDDVLDELAEANPSAAEVVKYLYFAGYTLDEAAGLLGISRSTVQRRWNFARAWLFRRISPDHDSTANLPNS